MRLALPTQYRVSVAFAAVVLSGLIFLYYPFGIEKETFDKQLAIAPLILIAFIFLKVPKSALVALLLSTAGIALHNSNITWHRGQEILLARFEHDPLLKRSTSWKNTLNLNNIFSTRILPSIASNSRQATDLAKANNALVVWSHRHRISLTPPPSPPFEGDAFIRKISGLQIITSIPEITYPDVTKIEGIRFLKSLSQGLYYYSIGDARGEMMLLRAAHSKGRWSSYQHQAFILYVLGTSQLRQAFSYKAPTLPIVICAIKTLKRADRLLAQSRSPTSTSVAVHNNIAVANALLYQYTRKRTYYAKAKTSFMMARGQNKALARHSLYATSSVPLENYVTIFSQTIKKPRKVTKKPAAQFITKKTNIDKKSL